MLSEKVSKRIYVVGNFFLGKVFMETGDKFSKPKLFKMRSNPDTVGKLNFADTVHILPYQHTTTKRIHHAKYDCLKTIKLAKISTW